LSAKSYTRYNNKVLREDRILKKKLTKSFKQEIGLKPVDENISEIHAYLLSFSSFATDTRPSLPVRIMPGIVLVQSSDIVSNVVWIHFLFILRMDEGNYYQLVREGYFHRLMDGHVLKSSPATINIDLYY
jgi:hypothetical protein